MDRLLWVSLSRIGRDWRSTLAIDQAANGCGLASHGLSLVLLPKLGIDISESSVTKYMLRCRKPPSQTWHTFLDNHLSQVGRGRDISCLMPPAQIRTGAR